MGSRKNSRKRSSPTLVDVARKAGVSVSTAGRALRDSGWPLDSGLKERVLTAAYQLSYVPNVLARNLRAGGAPALVGLVAGNMLDPYYGEIAEAVTRHAEASHMMLAMVCNMQRDPILELRYCRELWEHRVAGLILAGGGFDQLTHQREFSTILDQMSRNGVVIVTLSPRDIEAPAFCVDNRIVGQIAASQLIDRGHRNIAIAIGRILNNVRKERLSSMIKVLKSVGAEYHVVEPDEGSGVSVEALLVRERGITGIIASSQLISTEIMNSVRKARRSIPEDLSIVAIGKSRLGEWIVPRITHIDLELDACGRAALDYIAAKVAGKPYVESAAIPPRLVLGESVATIT